ncbi:MAG: hypothetical protein ACLSGB_07870 [Dorea sp.]
MAMKVHSKIVSDHQKDGWIRSSTITQIGTGNYNEKTARLYTDLSLDDVRIRRSVRKQQQGIPGDYFWEKRCRTQKSSGGAKVSAEADYLILIEEEIQSWQREAKKRLYRNQNEFSD